MPTRQARPRPHPATTAIARAALGTLLLVAATTRPAASQGFPLGVRVDLATGASPYQVSIGDLNGDGFPDMVVANGGANTVSVLLSDGNGKFGPKTNFATGTLPTTVVIGDLNGDGKPDLVVTNNGSNSVSLLFGNGAGDFAVHTDIPVGVGPYVVAIGDINGDGHLDLAVANYGSNNVTVLLGDGAGHFTAAPNSPFTSGTNPSAVAIGDVNGDGKPDLLVTNQGSNTVSLLPGDGAGGFGARRDFATGLVPQWVVVSDLNGDGKLDLVVTNNGSNSVSVLLGDGAGGFSPHTDYAVGVHPQWPAVGDLDGDGNPDIAVPNYNSASVSILIGDGSGAFGTATSLPTGATPVSAAIADLNGDGRRDLVVTNLSSNSASMFLAAPIPGALLTVPALTADAIAMGDINGDGLADIAVTRSSADSIEVSLATSSGFPTATAYPADPRPAGIAFGYANTDSSLDLLVTSPGSQAMSAYLNHGDGTFGPRIDSPTPYTPDWLGYPTLSSGSAPLILSSGLNKAFLMFSNGDGTFFWDSRFSWTTETLPNSAAVGDLDGTGVSSLVTGGSTGVSVQPDILNEPPPPAYELAPPGGGPCEVALGDLNGDGFPDLAVTTGSNTLLIYLNTGTGIFGTPASYTLPGHSVISIAVIDRNGDGRPDVLVSSLADSASYVIGVQSEFLGDGAGGLGPRIDLHGPYGASFALGDVNGDGRLDVGWAGSPPRVQLTPSRTRTVLVASVGSVPQGSPITLTATVQPTRIVPATSSVGTMAFFDGTTPLGTAPVTWAVTAGSPPLWTGTASLASTMSRAGIRSLSAVYSGDGRRAGSIAAPVAVQVIPGTLSVPGGVASSFGLDRMTSPVTGALLRVGFSLPGGAAAALEVYDVNGRRIAAREVGSLSAGHHVQDLRFDRPLASGVYFVRLRQGASVANARVSVLQ